MHRFAIKVYNAVLAAGCDWTTEDIEVVKKETTKITDWWMDELRKGNNYKLYHTNRTCGRMKTPRKRYPCGAGRKMVGIDTNGDIWPCHRFCNGKQVNYKLGNIYNGITNHELISKIINHDNTESKLPYVCLHECVTSGKGFYDPPEYLHDLWDFYYKEGERAHLKMMSENNQLYIKLYVNPPIPKSQIKISS